jgi:hypothetical protein
MGVTGTVLRRTVVQVVRAAIDSSARVGVRMITVRCGGTREVRGQPVRNLDNVVMTLEQRRLAIAEALRAVMAEPPPRSQPVPAAARPVLVTAMPALEADDVPLPPIRELIARVSEPAAPASAPKPVAASHQPAVDEPAEPIRRPERGIGLLPMREALAAQIDWDEADDPSAEPGVAEPGAAEETIVELAAVELPAAEDPAADDSAGEEETPSVPPLELAGSMSRAASVALFGHA